MIKFKVCPYSHTITKVEVARESADFVTIEGEGLSWGGQKEKWKRREKKAGVYFDSWQEAHEFLLRQASDRLDSLNMQARGALKKLELIKAMKDETE
jgi:hypothetical protein